MLPADYCRCLGHYEGKVCERMDRCARHLALRHDPKLAYRSCADRLCYSEFTFFVEVKDAIGKS